MLEEDNRPSAYRMQHGAFTGRQAIQTLRVFDIAYDMGIIDSHQRSDCEHFYLMREAFARTTAPRDTIVGKLMSSTGDGGYYGDYSLSDKYFQMLRLIPKWAQNILLALVCEASHPRKYYVDLLAKSRDSVAECMEVYKKALE